MNDRYQRHSLIDWFSLDKVRSMSIAVVGAGAIGNEVIKNLVLLGVGNVDIYDQDIIEEHNLTRSVLFRSEDIGRGKAEVAAMRARELDESVRIDYFHGDVWEQLNLSQLSKYSALISCVDNFESRLKLNEMCLLVKTDFINTGIDSRYASIEFYPYRSSAVSGCYECGLPDTVYEQMSKRYSCGWLKRVAVTEKKIPTTIITSSLAGSLAASAALRLGQGDYYANNFKIILDSITHNMTRFKVTHNQECPTCNIPSTRLLIQGNASIQSNLMNILAEDTSISLRTSDPLITSASCKHGCGPLNISFPARSRDFTELLQICPVCEDTSVEIKIEDQFTVHNLYKYHLLKKLPCKYITANIDDICYVINLEACLI